MLGIISYVCVVYANDIHFSVQNLTLLATMNMGLSVPMMSTIPGHMEQG